MFDLLKIPLKNENYSFCMKRAADLNNQFVQGGQRIDTSLVVRIPWKNEEERVITLTC
jgi:hypothetical protein